MLFLTVNLLLGMGKAPDWRTARHYSKAKEKKNKKIKKEGGGEEGPRNYLSV